MMDGDLTNDQLLDLVRGLPHNIDTLHRVVLVDGGADRLLAAGGVPPLVKMLGDTSDIFDCAFAAWTLLNMTVGPETEEATFIRRQAIVDAGAVSRLITLLSLCDGAVAGENDQGDDGDDEEDDEKTHSRVVMAALSILWNLTAGHSTQGNQSRSETIIAAGAIPRLVDLLRTAKQSFVRTPAGRCLLGLSACNMGTSALIELLPSLVSLLPAAGAPLDNVQVDVFFLLSNISSFGSEQDLERLRELKVAELAASWLGVATVSVNAAIIVSNLLGHIDGHPLMDMQHELVSTMLLELELALDGETSSNGIVMMEAWELAMSVANLSGARTNRRKLAKMPSCLPLLRRLVTEHTEDTRCTRHATTTLVNLANDPETAATTDADLYALVPHLESLARVNKNAAARDDLRRAAYQLRSALASRHEDSVDAALVTRRPSTTSLLDEEAREQAQDLQREQQHQRVQHRAFVAHDGGLDAQAYLEPIKKTCKQSGWSVMEVVGGTTALSDLQAAIASASYSVVVACLSSTFKGHEACRENLEVAAGAAVPVVGVVVQGGYQPSGWLNAVTAKQPLVNTCPESVNHTLAQRLSSLPGTKPCLKVRAARPQGKPCPVPVASTGFEDRLLTSHSLRAASVLVDASRVPTRTCCAAETQRPTRAPTPAVPSTTQTITTTATTTLAATLTAAPSPIRVAQQVERRNCTIM